MVRIELFDDDNGNSEVDVSLDSQQAISDDVYVYNLILDWEGWKEVRIPFTYFEDDNPYVGDNVFNPYHINQSKGLLQMQLVFLAVKNPEQEVFLRVDSVVLN